MKWRFLAASVATALFFGLGINADAQDGARAAKPEEKGKAAPVAANPTAPKVKPKKSSLHSKSRTGSAENSTSPQSRVEYATFGAGCFWCVEATFERLPGVISAVSGYAGGTVRNPTYEMVHEGLTGHAEVVMVEYDPDVISYEQLLKVFWSHHDPTTPNQQGPDVGTQYRSIILYHNEAQRKAALKSYQELVDKRVWRNPIVTQLVPLKAFYRAEDYHQDYYGGKPQTTARRRKTSVSKARKTQSATTSPAAPVEAASPDHSADAPAPRP